MARVSLPPAQYARLRQAIARNEFKLAYQAQVDLASGRIIGLAQHQPRIGAEFQHGEKHREIELLVVKRQMPGVAKDAKQIKEVKGRYVTRALLF